MNEKNTISSITYDDIKKDIIFGKLKPSIKLKLDNLKNNYNASLSTIRETLNRLASEGFVKAEEQRKQAEIERLLREKEENSNTIF